MKRLLKGFSLIELMVVIGIIGMLVAGGFVAITSAQRGGREDRRRQDVIAVASMLEAYYASAASYPVPAAATWASLQTALGTSYKLPTPANATYPYSYGSDGSRYCLCAKLEATTGTGNNLKGGANTDGTCAAAAGTVRYYCVMGGQ